MKYGIDKEAAKLSYALLVFEGKIKLPPSHSPPPLEETLPTGLITWPKKEK